MDTTVYLMGEVGSNYVKIGRAGDPASRRRSIQTGNPRNIVLHFVMPTSSVAEAEAVERDLHALFARVRANGEWFDDAGGEVYRYFAENARRFAPRGPGRPIKSDKTDVPEIPERVLERYRKLVRQKGTAVAVPEIIKATSCTRAVARYLAANREKYAK